MTNHTTYTIDVELTDEEVASVQTVGPDQWYTKAPPESFYDAMTKMRQAFVNQHPPTPCTIDKVVDEATS